MKALPVLLLVLPLSLLAAPPEKGAQEVTLNGEIVNIQGTVDATIQEPLTVDGTVNATIQEPLEVVTDRQSMPVDMLCFDYDNAPLGEGTSIATDDAACNYYTKIRIQINSRTDTAVNVRVLVREASNHSVEYFLGFVMMQFEETIKTEVIDFGLPLDVGSVLVDPEFVIERRVYASTGGGSAYANIDFLAQGYLELP